MKIDVEDRASERRVLNFLDQREPALPPISSSTKIFSPAAWLSSALISRFETWSASGLSFEPYITAGTEPLALSFRTAERPMAVRRSAVSFACLAMS